MRRILKLLEAGSTECWRAWLEEHCSSEREVWLVFRRAGSRKPSIPYGEAVTEALCFGWIDSIVRRLDETRCVRRFTPRRPGSSWSALNRSRALRAMEEGRMAEPGMALVRHARASGRWDSLPVKPSIDKCAIPAELEEGLRRRPAARSGFMELPESCRRRYVLWIATAKRKETRERRAAEALNLLERGERLGLK